MDLLDIIIIAVAIGAATHGLRLGAAVQLASLAGFLLGLAAGVALVLLVGPHVAGQLTKTAVALVLLLVPAAICGGVGRRLGTRAWRALRRRRIGRLDQLAGALIAVAGTLVVSWFFASILVNSGFAPVARQIERSRIVRAVEGVMPPVPDAFATVERYLSTSGFPQVLVNILPESVAPVTMPSLAAVRAAMATAGPSTVKVVALGCGQEQEGSGFAAARDLVVTNAHVVAGTRSISVVEPSGRVLAAEPVLFDPRFDLALLRVGGLHLRPLAIDRNFVERGSDAVVLGYPGGGAFTADAAGIRARFAAEGRDIYDTHLTVRTVYELQALVRPGNSGGPLVTPTGEVIGVVFSRSATEPDVGYALASPGVALRVREARDASRPVSTQGCTS
ncbi:MAG TPA: MarP family serine protease [Acidimicrobiales bacterium]|nr:MarP family serine protease [Acidimicrobiales bacterium]